MGCSPEGPLATIGVPVGTATGAGATSRTATGMGAGALWAAANASVAGVWLQDWAGAYAQTILNMTQMRLRWNWVLDRQLYPQWEEMVASLGARGT